MARPKLKINADDVRKLAQLGCRTQEIADFVGCSKDTIEGRFSAELRKGRSELRISLRKEQLNAAMKGNVVMLIWLGKQMLGQADDPNKEILSGTPFQLVINAPKED